ncbi:hypothetical protein QAD02_024323 [Eretmocerus hayati]|uniref:Uncharacterized protein n=1 Tax=Eretmocerus hayati TaxID=131215 RepID=A0ACC2Q012_9HYME|nr:hypothetical protein QAD02_024323 [Eretmocerus hayati]
MMHLITDYYSSRRQLYDDDPLIQRVKQPVPDPRFITFQKEGSVGVRLTGGNETGVFVTAVQPGSPASLQGLQPGDKILKVNDMDMKGVTREEAVLFLLSLQEQIDLIVQHRRQEYEQIIASGKGDSFHIKTHFHYENPEKGEMSFRSGDVFHVVDTLHNGVVGAWQVFRIGRNNQEVQKGIIPNEARAEELATAQFNATKKELSANESRGSFFRRRRGSHRRSKSLGRDHWDDVVFSDSVSKFPAYERVVLRHPGFVRPIVLFGPVADLAREKLFKDFPDKFTAPQSECQIEEGSSSRSTKTSGIIRLSAIRDVMERGKHALLDITPNAVDRLNYAQFYPIVIFFKAETKQTVKEMGAGIPKSAHKSSKKLLEQCQKLDKIWGHVFSATITLTSPESWYRKLRELIDWQQQGPLWMSQTKPEEALSDDFLFPMTSRLSYASSPESDLELSPAPSLPGTLTAPSRLKSSSDPSIATQDDAVAPPPYTTAGYQQLVQSLNSTSIGGNGPSANATLSNGTSTDVLSQQQQQQSSTSQLQMQQAHQFSPSAADISGAYAEQQRRRSQQQGPPDLPPRLDRNSKPPHHGGSATSPVRSAGVGAPGSAGGSAAGVYSQHGTMRSAQERLISKADSCLDMGNYINATPHRATAATASTTTLERTQAKAGSYDSMSSYDSYNTNGNVAYPGSGRLGPNVPDDLKTSTLGVSSRPHDPYRFTRSTAIPVQESQPRTDYAKYSRAGEYKPAPPPHGKSTGTYKPIPPPKPKNYRPPQQTMVQDENNGGSLYQHAKSYSMGNSHMHNGAGNGMDMQRNSNQYYYNITPNRGAQNDGYSVNSNHNHSHTSPSSHNHSMSHSHHLSSPSMMSHSHSNSSGQIGVAHSSHNRNVAMNGHSHSNSHSGVSLQSSNAVNNSHNRESSALDLAGSREQRGSAFELYRKPLHHHNMRPMGMARGTFGNEGGVLEGPGGVSLIIPPGALPPNSHQEIHFSVTDPNGVELYSNIRGHRSSLSPPMHNGESMLSPLVECGPKGLEFLCPIELRIPHSATPAHRLALKATDTEGNHNANWLNVKLPDPTSDHVIVRLDHF